MSHGLDAIRMLGIDIDGTMLGTDGSLSDATRRALHRARDAGIYVVPATGRPFVVAHDVIEALSINDYWVFANGAVTRHVGEAKTIRASWIRRNEAVALLQRLRAGLPEAGFAVEFELDIAYEAGFEDLVPVRPTIPPVMDVLDVLDHDVQKVLVFDATKSLDELYARTKSVIGDAGVASYSGLGFVEVAAALVTKAVALDALACDLGFTAAEVAVFGDNHNDVPMLEWAGFSFAMENGTDDAKEAADRVIGHTDDDGLARMIDEIVDAQTP